MQKGVKNMERQKTRGSLWCWIGISGFSECFVQCIDRQRSMDVNVCMSVYIPACLT